MYLLVCVYDSVAGKKKKSILLIYIFFGQTSAWQAFGWSSKLMPRAQGWRSPAAYSNQEDSSLKLAVGRAEDWHRKEPLLSAHLPSQVGSRRQGLTDRTWQSSRQREGWPAGKQRQPLPVPVQPLMGAIGTSPLSARHRNCCHLLHEAFPIAQNKQKPLIT